MKGSGLVRPDPSFLSALPIFPVRLQTSIFGAGELNFRVRDGNGWTLTAINTNLLSFEKKSKQKKTHPLRAKAGKLSETKSLIWFRYLEN